MTITMNVRQLAATATLTVAALSSAHAGEVCMAMADAATGTVLIQRGDCAGRVTPASTFKIALSLMGYDAGFLTDQHAPLIPFREGDIDWRPNWREPTDPSKWMRDSVVWYSLRITQSLGKARVADYTRRFDYGNADVSGDPNDAAAVAWINSSLRISPLEQLAFLSKLVKRTLGVNEHAYAMTAALTAFAPLPGGWDLHGKTGAAGGYGWYVGWATVGARSVVFARLEHDDAASPQDIPAGVRARDAFIAEAPALLAPAAH